MKVPHVRDNIIWNTLVGPHVGYATGARGARRYAQGFSPIIGFENADHPDFDALSPYCDPGELFYCGGWSGAAPLGWRIDAESTMFLMVRDGATPTTDEAPEAVRLGSEHIAQAMELAALTHPGPFGPRTIEYFGCFGGERLHAGTFHEISGVCTHPDFQGRGLARRLMSKPILRQLQPTRRRFSTSCAIIVAPIASMSEWASATTTKPRCALSRSLSAEQACARRCCPGEPMPV